jgi:hemolysin III
MLGRRRAYYSLGEEIAHSTIHGLGAVLSALGLMLLIVRASRTGDPWCTISFAIFGATMVLLYVSSTLYHALIPTRARKVFKILDHAAIYLLIAGTYTPFLLVSLRGSWGWSLFGIVWGLAIGGVLFKVFCVGRYKLVSTLLYLGMGWLGLIAAKPLLSQVPKGGLIWLLAGGLAYSAGTIFYHWRGMKYHHAVWHIFVLAGTLCHFWAVYEYIGQPQLAA